MNSTPSRERPSPGSQTVSPRSQDAPRILAVEDNAITREGLATVLRQAGYNVVTASDGQEALDCLREGLAPDLVLLDMLMDGVDGWRFLDAVRESPQTLAGPIIVMTGSILTREWAQQNGCQGFLRKPFETEDLIQEIERCLGRD